MTGGKGLAPITPRLRLEMSSWIFILRYRGYYNLGMTDIDFFNIVGELNLFGS